MQNALVANACTPAPGAPLAYYTLTPCRLIDTRNPTAPLAGPSLAGGGAQRSFTLSRVCGVPATARALSVNLTVVNPATAGDLRLVRLQNDAGGTVDLIVDVNGYYQ